jgi:antitoxin (DNA-binding transcriptional repressor) of toxin-antitoxin stability system
MTEVIMETIPIHKAKSTLSQLVKRAAAGETIYIGGYGKAEVALCPVPKINPVLAAYGCMKERPFPEGWDDPLPAEVIDSFYNMRGFEEFAAKE